MLKQPCMSLLFLPKTAKLLFPGTLLIYSLIRQNPWQCLLISIVIVMVLSQEYVGKISNLLRFKRVRVMLIICCTFFYTLAFTLKAHAIFFSQVETFLSSKFSAVPGFSTTIGLGIPTLRILLIAYIIWGFVKIAEAQNQGQDASGLFKTTVISLLIGFFGDEVLKQFIG